MNHDRLQRRMKATIRALASKVRVLEARVEELEAENEVLRRHDSLEVSLTGVGRSIVRLLVATSVLASYITVFAVYLAIVLLLAVWLFDFSLPVVVGSCVIAGVWMVVMCRKEFV